MCHEVKMIESIGATIDGCISDIVDALNKAGIRTSFSCCGHGRKTGTICLADGRNLLLLSQNEVARMSAKGTYHLIVLDKPVALCGNSDGKAFSGRPVK